MYEVTKTKEESKLLRKGLVDLLSFNSFQVPIYASAIAISSLFSEGKVDFEKVSDGSAYLASISPLIAPTLGWWANCFRRMFGLPSVTSERINKK